MTRMMIVNKEDFNKTIKLLVDSREAYYTTGRSKLSDQEYDALEDTIRQLDPNHPFFDRSTPILSTTWKTANHSIPMGSLSKIHSEEDFIKFAGKFEKELFTMQLKLDGLSISIDYKDSKFIRAITRGSREDGKEGEDISSNVRYMEGFKEEVLDLNTSLRAEIILSHENFEKINSILPDSEKYYVS